jgi:hypothetical protein
MPHISHRVSHEAREVVDSYDRDHLRRWFIREERRLIEEDESRQEMIVRRAQKRRNANGS